jgi:hypothetical protein
MISTHDEIEPNGNPGLAASLGSSRISGKDCAVGGAEKR